MSEAAAVGFSSRCFSPADYRLAVLANQAHGGDALEIGCDDAGLLPYLEGELPLLDLDGFERVTVQAPRFTDDDERVTAERLGSLDLPLVVHADRVRDVDAWRGPGRRVMVGNTGGPDRFGSAAEHLDGIFRALPEAGFCLDVAHAFTAGGPDLVERFARRFGDRLEQLHVGRPDVPRRPDAPRRPGGSLPDDPTLVGIALGALGRQVPVIIRRPVPTAWTQELSRTVRVLREVVVGFPAAVPV
ncbi:hypothetical protein [Saccharothrix yanglingensis]|uniref:Uncharacterized protein n=1 Tax=Saccharothrix yanglingensis TaxID=659496 RepID=A0ABU0XA74_9PSEU|nr:hypothetical protein [Saccharothrix yanglingensis]MDQ2589048.1 hypothetical protein [Saccharothrix yanglingensis]